MCVLEKESYQLLSYVLFFNIHQIVHTFLQKRNATEQIIVNVHYLTCWVYHCI